MERRAYEFDNKRKPSEDLDEKARKYQEDHEGVSYTDACVAVLREDKYLSERYAPPKTEEVEDTKNFAQATDYSDALRQLTMQAQEFTLATGIPEDLAFKRVLTLEKNRLLARCYIQGPQRRK